MTNHDPCPRWRRIFAAAVAVALLGACGGGPDLTTVTAGDEQIGSGSGSSDDRGTGEPEVQTGGQDPAPGQPGDEAPVVPGDGHEEPGSGEAGDGETGTAGTDEPVGPVGETETGGDSGATGPVAGPGEVGGFWWSRESKWATVIDEVFDMCDDSEAMIAVTGRRPSPGDDDITNDQTWLDRARDEILKFKTSRGVSCEEPGGLRYVTVTKNGPGPPGVSPQDAAKRLKDRAENSPFYGQVVGPPGTLLGSYGFFHHVPEPENAVKVMADKVTVIDGTIRGLVQNLSDTLWARDVTVAAGDKKWVWPLTVQPGEVAPFEIEGWTGTTDPAAIDLQVTATLSATVDVSRALMFIAGYDWQGTWDQYIASQFPDFAVPEPPAGEFSYTQAMVGPEAPTSHPSLADQALNQTINDLRAYVAFIDWSTHKVIEVREATTYDEKVIVTIHGSEHTNYEVTQIDFTNDSNFLLGFKIQWGWPYIWVGGAN